MKHSLQRIAAILALGLSTTPSVAQSDTFVHLFEFSWEEVALECEQYLGPKGYSAVQISPPQEHHSASNWWSRYQPVNFSSLTSRSGNIEQLKSMIERCHNAGVKVYADMVINHTADYGEKGVGTGGTPWRLMQHPELTVEHYHQPECSTKDWSDVYQVQNCKLGALPDLDTAHPHVQQVLANYFKRLSALGIDGFRIDAAKHMSANDISEILKQANSPWVFNEVIANPVAPKELQPVAYEHLGPVTDLTLQYAFSQFLKTGDMSQLIDPTQYDSSQRISFVDNHDTERHSGRLDWHGATESRYRLAQQILLLAYQAKPKLLASYKFDDRDIGRPAQAACGSQWICWHRDQALIDAVQLRKALDTEQVSLWVVSDDKSQLLFKRGDFFFLVNTADSAATIDAKLLANLAGMGIDHRMLIERSELKIISAY